MRRKRLLGIAIFSVIDMLVLWKAWEPEVSKFEWVVVGLCLNMEGVVLLGFGGRWQRYCLLKVNSTGWVLMFLGFFLQLFSSPFTRLL
jgi:hypothetical protein